MLKLKTLALACATAALAISTPAWAQSPSRAEVLSTMKKATQFMVDKVAYKGGYVWSYTPDMKRRWGELEAKPTMIWVQPPGTGTMGHLFLDAYHATGDDYYYRAAEKAADALVAGQHPSGGWNYLVDFAGEASLKDWYETYGKNAWRMEEFQHYYGNATFDDAGTSEAMQFLLRLYLEKKDEKYRPALDRAIDFVIESQYPSGGWPQRYPLKTDYSKGGRPDYTPYITFNDDVAGENIKFLIMVHQTLGDARALPAIRRAMDSFIITRQPAPQAGWALQYTLDLKPAGARSYEPLALATHTTANNLDQLMNFYELTGNPQYLAPVAEGLAWLEQVKLPADQVKGNRTHPTFIELGTNRPLYVHRRGSNVINGEYYVNYDPEKTVGHYGSTRAINLDALRARHERLKATPPEEAARHSPLKSGQQPLPRFFANRDLQTSDLSTRREEGEPAADTGAAKLVSSLNAEGYWPTLLRSTSNPYIGDGSPVPEPGDFSTTHVGDASDTSPYPDPTPELGISTSAYIQNMTALIDSLRAAPQ